VGGDVAGLFTALGNFGAMGILVAYLIWREGCERKERREQALERQKIEEADIASREKLASSLTALSMVIQGRPHV
jgi:hypothetical protein